MKTIFHQRETETETDRETERQRDRERQAKILLINSHFAFLLLTEMPTEFS